MLQAQKGPEPSAAHALAVGMMCAAIVPIYNRLAALSDVHRLSWLGCGLTFAMCCPPYSELGRPAEPLCLGSALLLGEVPGLPSNPNPDYWP